VSGKFLNEEEQTMRIAVPIVVTAEERTTLERWVRGRRTPARLVRRAQIVLRAAAGQRNDEIAAALATDRECVGRWRHRFALERLAGIERDAPRTGRTPTIAPAALQRIVTLTSTATPPGATHWSTRTLAAAVGVSPKTVHRIWPAQRLQPHRTRRFKVSRDRRFVEKLTDVAGLYVIPPSTPGALRR
jgi:transposase